MHEVMVFGAHLCERFLADIRDHGQRCNYLLLNVPLRLFPTVNGRV